MQKLAPSRETSLMRLSIRAGACLDTPIHNPPPPPPASVLQTCRRCPQVKVTCGKSACYHHYHHYGFTEFPTHCVISLTEKAENFEMDKGNHVKIRNFYAFFFLLTVIFTHKKSFFFTGKLTVVQTQTCVFVSAVSNESHSLIYCITQTH